MLRSERSCGVNVVKVDPSALLGSPRRCGGDSGKVIAPSRVLTVLSAAQLEPPTLATDAAAALSASLTFFFFFFFLTSPFAARATMEATPDSFFPIAPTFLESRLLTDDPRRPVVAFFRRPKLIFEGYLLLTLRPLPVDVSLTRPARFSRPCTVTRVRPAV